MFVYLHEMRSERMKWLDFAQVNTYIKERQKKQNVMQWGVGAFDVYCFFFDLEETHICWHVSFIIFNFVFFLQLSLFLLIDLFCPPTTHYTHKHTRTPPA